MWIIIFHMVIVHKQFILPKITKPKVMLMKFIRQKKISLLLRQKGGKNINFELKGEKGEVFLL